LKTTAQALQLANSNKIKTLLNPAPMRDDFPMEILDSVDILTPNETEFAHLVRAHFQKEHVSFSESQILDLGPEELHALCREFGVPTFIITLGSKGCFCSTSDSHFHVPSITGINVVDTTGAGDAFVGGFSSGLVQFDGDIEKAARYGSIVAGLSVTQFGTAPSMPMSDAIQAEINKQGLVF
jgi:ribokinase